MSQQMAKTVKIALNKGLITEATPLTYPENATKDELNVALDHKGSRSKRKGIQVEDGGSWFGSSSATVYSTFLWESAGGIKGRSYLVVQMDSVLHFFDPRLRPMSQTPKHTMSVASYFTSGTGIPKLEFTSCKGILVCVGENVNSFTVSDSGTSLRSERLAFRIRDFEWMTKPKTSLVHLSPVDTIQRRYDSYNTGWNSHNMSIFRGNFGGNFPPLNKYMWTSVNNDGDPFFSQATWNRIEGGSTLISNGRFILNLYDMDRDGVSGVGGVNAYAASVGLGPERTRFTTVANYAGRVFFSGMSSSRSSGRVYFSQVVESSEEIGEFYSKNDPTAEYLSDLLDTDGGYVDIQEAEGIQKLHVFGTHLLVFASNGVWAISGVDDVFRATNYTVNCLGKVDTSSVSSFVSAEGRPYWWSDSAIMTVTISEFKNLELVSVSDSSVKTFFQDIPRSTRDKAVGAFDAKNRQVFWLYGDGNRDILILDETHGAFIPWRISPGLREESLITAFFNRYLPEEDIPDSVVDETYDNVVTSSGDLVLSNTTVKLDDINTFVFLVADNRESLAFAYFSTDSLLDWGVSDYECYIETGYSFLGDLSSAKSTPYLTVLLKQTETGWTTGFTPRGQSSLLASVFWDGSLTPAYPPQQVYRTHRFEYPTSAFSPFNSGYDLVQTKIIPRGRGKNMRIRFEAESGKDFQLLGFETIDAKNPSV